MEHPKAAVACDRDRDAEIFKEVAELLRESGGFGVILRLEFRAFRLEFMQDRAGRSHGERVADECAGKERHANFRTGIVAEVPCR